MNENVKTIASSDRREKFLGIFSYRNHHRFRMSAFLMLSDISSFVLAGLLAVGIRVVFGEKFNSDLLLQVLPILFFSLLFFGLTGLYPAVGVSVVEEIKRLVSASTLVLLSFTALSFWLRNADVFSRLTLSLTWFFSIFFLPIFRDITRVIAIRSKLWGEPIAIIGFKKQGQWALDFFLKNKKLGFNPVVILDTSSDNSYPKPSVRVVKVDALYPKDGISILTDVKTALVVLQDVPEKIMSMISSNQEGGWERLILLPNLEQISSFGVMSFDFGGVLGLEVKHNLVNPFQKVLKRTLDLFLVIVGGVFISPFLILIAILLFIQIRGNIFYGHTRIGKNGKKFKAWKFKTMINNADEILAKYLNENPALRAEWEETHKLRNDPRVTSFGKFLRKYSLDEFPQLYNIIKGEMSLVGPRPIVEDEVHYYGDLFDPYTWVSPGMTGMWQVSGRSDTAYSQRVFLDEYYVRNWSIWLDIFILSRTILVVLQKKGAY